MTGILKITQGSVLALHVVMLLAKGSGKPMSTKEAAKSLAVSQTHLSKVLQGLGKAGIVRATRGPHGGYVLVRALVEIRLLDILESIEGPIKLDRCRLSMPECRNGDCVLDSLLNSINSQVLRNFEKRLSEVCTE